MSSSPSSPHEVTDAVWSRRIATPLFKHSLRPLPRTSGVYGIINRDTNKIYVGSSQRVNWRLNCHLSEFRSGTHSNKALCGDFNKTPEAFEFILIEEVHGAQNLKERERFWVLFFQSHRAGYNSTLRFSRRMVEGRVSGRKPWTEDKRKLMSDMASNEKRKVARLDENGVVVSVFDSVKGAAREMGGDKGNLLAALRNPKRKFRGFFWKHA